MLGDGGLWHWLTVTCFLICGIGSWDDLVHTITMKNTIGLWDNPYIYIYISIYCIIYIIMVHSIQSHNKPSFFVFFSVERWNHCIPKCEWSRRLVRHEVQVFRHGAAPAVVPWWSFEAFFLELCMSQKLEEPGKPHEHSDY